MILPIVAFGDPVLRKVAKDITPEYPNLDTLLENMFETMYNAYGVGLAGPQIGLPIRLFMVDATGFAEDEELDEAQRKQLEGMKKVFINAKILERNGEPWVFNEGCLSIPDVREDVFRPESIKIEYMMKILRNM